MEEITGGCCWRLYPLHQGLQKLGEGFPAELRRSRKRRIGKQVGSEIKKDKIGDCGASASTEVPLSELFKKELAKKKSKHLRNKRRREEETGGAESESLGKSRLGEDNNNSGIFEKLASGDDETVKPQEIEQMGEENDEEERGSKAEKITFLIPSYENNSSELPTGSNGVVVDTVVSPPETRQNSGCDDEVDGNDINAEKKNMVDDGTKEAECLVHECSEKHRSNEKKDDDERLKQRKLAINELALNLEARIMKAEKTLAKIKEWKTNKALAN